LSKIIHQFIIDERGASTMNYIFISPQFPKNFWKFCDRLKREGVTVLGIGDSPYDQLSDELKDSLVEYYKVDSLEDYDAVVRAVGFFIHKYGKIDWIESNNEYWLEMDAKLRTDFNIKTGFQIEEVKEIKHKSKMKKYYQIANLKVARYHLCDTLLNAKKFIKEVGYPVVVKPDNGVGAAATYKINNDQELKAFYQVDTITPYIMEEFVNGLICTYDGIVDKDNQPVFEISHIFPTPIMNIVNDKKDLSYYSVRKIDPVLLEMGRKTLKSFNVKARCFHFEYFKLLEDKEGLGKKGDYIGLEVNMRTPGGYTPDMMSYACDIDFYQRYADMVSDKKEYLDYTYQYYCVYASRRDKQIYKHSHTEIFSKYEQDMVMYERMPDILSAAMGNIAYTARFKTLKEVNKFITFVQA